RRRPAPAGCPTRGTAPGGGRRSSPGRRARRPRRAGARWSRAAYAAPAAPAPPRPGRRTIPTRRPRSRCALAAGRTAPPRSRPRCAAGRRGRRGCRAESGSVADAPSVSRRAWWTSYPCGSVCKGEGPYLILLRRRKSGQGEEAAGETPAGETGRSQARQENRRVAEASGRRIVLAARRRQVRAVDDVDAVRPQAALRGAAGADVGERRLVTCGVFVGAVAVAVQPQGDAVPPRRVHQGVEVAQAVRPALAAAVRQP